MLRRRMLYGGSIEIPYSQAKAGNVLCSDMKIVSKENYSISGKTAIGILFYNSSGVLKAMSLTHYPIMFGWEEDVPGLTARYTEQDALQETDGKTNTTAMVEFYGISEYNAGGKCRLFSTLGTSAGDWDLPALGELAIIGSNLTAITASLTEVSGTAISTFRHVSSTERADTYRWDCILQTLTYSIQLKSNNAYVRPIITINY